MESIEPIEIDVELNTADILRYVSFFLFRKGPASILSIMGFPIMILGVVYYIYLSISGQAIPNFVYFLVIIFIFSSLLMFFLLFQAWKTRKNTHIIFGYDSINAFTADTEVKLLWSKFTNIFETKKDFLFIAAGNGSFIIPKRFFDSGQFNNFRDLLFITVGTRAKLKR